jgi:hypothetical protein
VSLRLLSKLSRVQASKETTGAVLLIAPNEAVNRSLTSAQLLRQARQLQQAQEAGPKSPTPQGRHVCVGAPERVSFVL